MNALLFTMTRNTCSPLVRSINEVLEVFRKTCAQPQFWIYGGEKTCVEHAQCYKFHYCSKHLSKLISFLVQIWHFAVSWSQCYICCKAHLLCFYNLVLLLCVSTDLFVFSLSDSLVFDAQLYCVHRFIVFIWSASLYFMQVRIWCQIYLCYYAQLVLWVIY